MKKVYIVAAKRTAIGKLMGSLSTFNPGELGSIVIKNLLDETGVPADKIDEVISGNVIICRTTSRYCKTGSNQSWYSSRGSCLWN